MKKPKIQKRSRGQTAVYETWEWIYAPWNLRPATWKQIEDECKKGARIRVIQWPEGTEIFRNGQYFVPDELAKESHAIREES